MCAFEGVCACCWCVCPCVCASLCVIDVVCARVRVGALSVCLTRVCACVLSCMAAFSVRLSGSVRAACMHGTSRDDGLQLRAVDEGPLDGLRLDVGPVDALLLRVVVHHRHVVDVRHRQRRHHVHVRVVHVHAADLRAPHVQQELLQRWGTVK